MKVYELTYIINSEITSEEAQAYAKELETLIQNKEGVILNHVNPAARTLAYPVNKRTSGFFGVLEFQTEPEKVGEVKEAVLKEEKIARHLLSLKKPVKIREKRSKPKPEFTFESAGSQPAAPESILKEKDKEGLKTEEEKPAFDEKQSKDKEKADLKEIEQTLDELLGE